MGAGGFQQIQALKKEISILRAEVQALRKAVGSLQALKPTLTTLMPDFAERFHVMHYAGDAGAQDIARLTHGPADEVDDAVHRVFVDQMRDPG